MGGATRPRRPGGGPPQGEALTFREGTSGTNVTTLADLDIVSHGAEQTIEGKELLARAFQHEMDHLDGTVFVDRLRGIKRDLIVRKIQKLKRSGKW